MKDSADKSDSEIANGVADQASLLVMARTSADTLLVLVFVCGIALPAIQTVFQVLPKLESFEKRQLASLPGRPNNLSELVALPAEFEAYFNDHFGFRNRFIRWNNFVRVNLPKSPAQTLDQRQHQRRLSGNTVSRAEGKSSRPALGPQAGGEAAPLQLDVRRGKDGWLFLPGGYYRGRNFSAKELAMLRRELEDRNDWLTKRGIRYLLVFCGNKHSIYPEKYPNPEELRGPTRLDQLVEALEKNSNLPFIDLRQPLLDAKSQYPTYYKTDSHWNDFGAFVAYREITIRLHQWFPNVRPWPLDNFEIRSRVSSGGFTAQALGLADQFSEDLIEMLPRIPRQADPSFPLEQGFDVFGVPYLTGHETTHPNKDLPRAVILHDSFFLNLMPYLSEHFSRAKYSWVMRFHFDRQMIKDESPDVVIQQFVERTLAQGSR